MLDIKIDGLYIVNNRQRTECKVPVGHGDDFGMFYRVVKKRGYLPFFLFPAVRDTAAFPSLRND
ncbi:hypothetical protein WJ85_15065 [Burkholderia ubonensis]|uniref:hypothetical protein n=1 Tax=Burkholderia ubonensis TaxID=101571 RepID=UPI00076D6F1E|nr:hypothetical protein [Burkholderia ubonensis]KVO29173.1 hypothetical protein WJ76_25460 [Burkholderia ubonensis]KVP15026.1 hypothetical protein WJ85_15065 [Burkholderia ubonensis]